MKTTQIDPSIAAAFADFNQAFQRHEECLTRRLAMTPVHIRKDAEMGLHWGGRQPGGNNVIALLVIAATMVLLVLVGLAPALVALLQVQP